MVLEVVLPFWPTCQDNLQWSDEDLIAVAGGSTIAILVPRLDLLTSDSLKWDTVLLKADGFTRAEVQPSIPLSRKDWSIGEELATRTISALKWSPSGVGIFDSCILAVLHSDHTLALWECVGRPELNESWTKCCIINHALQNYFGPAKYVEHRVRAFDWQPVTSSTDSGKAFLAIGTDAGGILVMDIQSPYHSSDVEKQWLVSISSHVNCQHAKAEGQSRFQYTSRASISDLTWAARGDVLMLLSNGVPQVVEVSISGQDRIVTTTRPWLCLQEDHPITGLQGPLRSLAFGDPNTFICFQQDTMLAVHTRIDQQEKVVINSTPLDTNWSEVSGLCIEKQGNGSCLIQLSTHQACQGFGDSYFRLEGLEFEQLETIPTWQEDLQNLVETYNTQNGLGGNVRTRTWGLACMPGREYTAVCISMMPSDSVAHVINSDQVCSVLISSNHDRTSEPAQASETSSLLIRAYNMLNKRNEDEVQRPTTEIWTAALATAVRDYQCHLGGHSSRLGVDSVRSRLYSDHTMAGQRAEVLVRRICFAATKASMSPASYRALLDIVSSVFDTHISSDTLSKTIFYCQQQMARKLQERDAPSIQLTDLPNTGQELCSICDRPMLFEAAKWARCQAGHKFIRCALTLLAIPRSNLSKSCSICGTQYLNELKSDEISSLLAQSAEDQERLFVGTEGSPRSSTASESSAAILLLNACNRCLMCGGKFVPT